MNDMVKAKDNTKKSKVMKIAHAIRRKSYLSNRGKNMSYALRISWAINKGGKAVGRYLCGEAGRDAYAIDLHTMEVKVFYDGSTEGAASWARQQEGLADMPSGQIIDQHIESLSPMAAREAVKHIPTTNS